MARCRSHTSACNRDCTAEKGRRSLGRNEEGVRVTEARGLSAGEVGAEESLPNRDRLRLRLRLRDFDFLRPDFDSFFSDLEGMDLLREGVAGEAAAAGAAEAAAE